MDKASTIVLMVSLIIIMLGSTAFSIAPAIYSLLMFFAGGVVIYVGLKRDRAGIDTAAPVTA